MIILKHKISRILNFIKNEGKFERGDMVKILNLTENEKYDNNLVSYKQYEGLYGIVVDINYAKKDYIIGVKFENNQVLDFKVDELEKIQSENPIRYKKLNIEY